MRKKGSRGQNWSLEILIALGVFIVVFVIASVFMFYLSSDPARNIKKQSDATLGSLEKDLALIDSGEINIDVLTELEYMTCEELRDLFAITGDMCVHFESVDGSLIPVGNKIAIGCPGISFNNGVLCGENVTDGGSFHVDNPVTGCQAVLHLNADDYVAFWLNEELVMDSNLLWHEGTKSTTINLRKRNILAAKARNAFVTAGRDRGFIASIELKEAGLTRNIVSNGNWLSYDQEPSSNWMQFDYDDRLWRSATVLGDVGISPWGMMSNIHSSAKWIWSYDYLVSGKREDTEPSWFRRKIFSSECPD